MVISEMFKRLIAIYFHLENPLACLILASIKDVGYNRAEPNRQAEFI